MLISKLTCALLSRAGSLCHGDVQNRPRNATTSTPVALAVPNCSRAAAFLVAKVQACCAQAWTTCRKSAWPTEPCWGPASTAKAHASVSEARPCSQVTAEDENQACRIVGIDSGKLGRSRKLHGSGLPAGQTLTFWLRAEAITNCSKLTACPSPATACQMRFLSAACAPGSLTSACS